ncbi:MAG: porin [Stigonema ocellatum SAG 48.90 = DSM 106950]|nr:porin [Stigonema ocellatum SAG 48.90 = DSM 106950]
MSQSVSDCYKFTFLQQCYRIYLLLCTTSSSIFWLLAMSGASLAQANPSNQKASDFQLGLGGLLPVPQSPIPGGQQWLRMMPPPQGAFGSDTPEATAGVVVPSLFSPFSKAVQTPGGDIKQLENTFLQQRIPKQAPKARPSFVSGDASVLQPHTQRQTHLPQLLVGDNSDVGLGLLGVTNNSQVAAPNTQAAPLPPLPGMTARQEFTAPGTPTFNQLLNSGAVRPPSVPSEQGRTSNQLLNCQVVASPSVPSNQGQTFNQLLNCQVVAPPSVNQLPNTQSPSNTAQSQEFSINPTAPVPKDAIPPVTPPPAIQPRSLINSRALKEPFLHFQGVYVNQGSTSSARARLEGVYPLTPQALFGATLDLTSQNSTFVDSRGQGLNINELYFATSLAGLPNLRVVVGQLDLTSYFDRNSFAKDGASQFFNPVFQTNPALAATGIASRTSLLVNWSVNDNIEAKAAVFSSADRISSFALDGFAGEIGVRYGNAIIRGTYATDRDAGVRDTFSEAFSIPRNQGRTVFGPLKDDREEAYGLNAEVFIPNLKLGLFGRYGRYENRDLGQGANTYIFGASLLDLFTRDDRVGLGYGRALSNEQLHRGNPLDVLEVYYDFPLLPHLRLGFTVQGRNGFEETVVGVRVKSDFDITPRRRSSP